MYWLLITMMGAVAGGAWEEDFRSQPASARPALEVCYTSAAREAFEISAQDFTLVGQLRAPHQLVDRDTNRPWLALSVTGADGVHYDTLSVPQPSRINLYRRGPYYCEIHWLDLQVCDASGSLAPLRGDLALYCYPEKLLASITWHATADFVAEAVTYTGLHGERTFVPEPFAAGSHQLFAFPVFNETEPLPESAWTTLEAHAPLRYDAVRGCYTIGSHNPGGFEEHFFRHPNYRERVTFTMRNNDVPRKIYICHETSSGSRGQVEGGVLLDADGHPLPLTVQVSKNFAGEKEEPFFNPRDTPFSENFFPLYLDAGESQTLTSVHLYQNWGTHMTKHFSSLGAWMDYFHSSTGVTETTCYVPFQFGGLPGVAIADFRAMSQDTFWNGQPQHDNVAGHSFLSYHDGQQWQYLSYRGTTYHSTGPNWMDVGLEYVSSDGKIRAQIRTWEYPQADELRNFIRVRYEAIAPLTVTNARENFRMLTVSSHVQSLQYTHASASGLPEIELDLSRDGFSVTGHPLPRQNSFCAVYGEKKGSNAIVIRNWERGVGPAVSVLTQLQERRRGGQTTMEAKTRLLLVADADEVRLEPGDVIEFDAFWLPYGERDGSRIPERETVCYGSGAPRISQVEVGTKVTDFPPVVRAEGNQAVFTLEGGRSSLAVHVSGLTEYRYPRIYRAESRGWVPLIQARSGALDGVQVNVDQDGCFMATLIVPSGGASQRLKVEAGAADMPRPRVQVSVAPKSEGQERFHVALVQAPWMGTPIRFRYPETVNTDALDFIDHVIAGAEPRGNPEELATIWSTDDASTLSFEWDIHRRRIGGRLSPNEDDVDLEFWIDNRNAGTHVGAQFCAVLEGTLFADPTLTRTYLHSGGAWVRMADTDRGGQDPALTHYPVTDGPDVVVPAPWGKGGVIADADVVAVVSADEKYVFAVAWPQARSILSNAHIPCIHADPVLPFGEAGRRVYVRGKLYLLEGNLDDLYQRVARDILRKF
ncbi:MAG: hypothetical protein ACYC0X_08830 [Pirellulaceae bacterium]